MTSDPTDNVIASYDAENRIASASTASGTFTYTYDADGNRVEKSGGGSGTLYWYMTPGIVAESDLAGNLKSEYVFFNGERVARRDFGSPGGVFYYFSDHLKTASVVTDSVGNIKSESDYYPWGGEIQFVNVDSNHYKFTGKERDSESGLDYFGARYYSNRLGRFITPDWAAKATAVPYAEFSDPQSLNLYSYVRNVPTVRGDPDGHCPICIPIVVQIIEDITIGELATAAWYRGCLGCWRWCSAKQSFELNGAGNRARSLCAGIVPRSPIRQDFQRQSHSEHVAEQSGAGNTGQGRGPCETRHTRKTRPPTNS